jgi:hypothetical protein
MILPDTQIAGKLTGDEYKRNLHFLTSSLKAIWAEVVNNISLIPPYVFETSFFPFFVFSSD